MPDKKKTNWSVSESVNRPASPSEGKLILQSGTSLPGQSGIGQGVSETPQGVLQRYRENKISRKASLAALQLRYDTELDALGHQLNKACQVEKAKVDVMAEEYLKELDAQHLEVLGELGLRNKETREKALLKLTESTVKTLREVQTQDWPPSLIEETISDILALRKRAVAEILAELGSDA